MLSLCLNVRVLFVYGVYVFCMFGCECVLCVRICDCINLRMALCMMCVCVVCCVHVWNVFV